MKRGSKVFQYTAGLLAGFIVLVLLILPLCNLAVTVFKLLFNGGL